RRGEYELLGEALAAPCHHLAAGEADHVGEDGGGEKEVERARQGTPENFDDGSGVLAPGDAHVSGGVVPQVAAELLVPREVESEAGDELLACLGRHVGVADEL